MIFMDIIGGDILNLLIQGNSLHIPLAGKSVNCCITSPPYYGLRDYGVDGQIGLEQTPDEYVNKLVDVFREVKRVLRDDGTLWLNLGDSYAGSGCGTNDYRTEKSRSINKTDVMFSKTPPQQKRMEGLKPKDLIGIPWRVAFALQSDGVADSKALEVIERAKIELLHQYEDDENGIPDKVLTVLEGLDKEYAEAKGNSWYLRSDIIWHKTNPMPESVKDRPTKAHEYIFLLTKNARYYYDAEAIKEPASSGYRGTDFLPLSEKDRMSNYKTSATGASINNRTVDKIYTRNKRSVWTVSTKPYKGAHYATFPPDLIEPCVLAGCPENGVVLDPFVGSGTTVMVANRKGRKGVGLDLSWKYLYENAKVRIVS